MNSSDFVKNLKSGRINAGQFAALLLLRFYQLTLSPLLTVLFGSGFGCRYYPTCSHYAMEAVTGHGLFKGGWMSALRLLRCQPFSKGGLDPVPQAVRIGARIQNTNHPERIRG